MSLSESLSGTKNVCALVPDLGRATVYYSCDILTTQQAVDPGEEDRAVLVGVARGVSGVHLCGTRGYS